MNLLKIKFQNLSFIYQYFIQSSTNKYDCVCTAGHYSLTENSPVLTGKLSVFFSTLQTNVVSSWLIE